MKYITAGLK